MTRKGVYEIRRIPEGMGCMPLEGVFTPDQITGCYAALEEASMDQYVWPDDGYRPEAHARVGWNSAGIHVLLYAKEEKVQALCTETGGRVCEDSCMEFFFMPFPEEDKRYLNAEMNPIGTLHLGIGEGRPGRIKLKGELPGDFVIYKSAHESAWWAVSYTIPMSHIEKEFGKRLGPGSVMRGNFYKCDESVHPHFGTWQPITSEKPDFHRPECFGEMILR